MAEVNDLDAACIGVLRDYSMLENRFAWVLAALLGVELDDGSRVLNIVRNNWTRHKLVGEFLRAKKPEFLPFWQQMKKALNGVDEGRNKVAHWYAVADHGVLDGGITPPSPIVHKLVPPGEVFVGDDVALQAPAVLEIQQNARYATRILTHFWMVLKWELENPDAEPHRLRGIFLEPPPDTILERMFRRIAEAHAHLPEERQP